MIPEIYCYSAAGLISAWLVGHFVYLMGVDAGRRQRSKSIEAWKQAATDYRRVADGRQPAHGHLHWVAGAD